MARGVNPKKADITNVSAEFTTTPPIFDVNKSLILILISLV